MAIFKEADSYPEWVEWNFPEKNNKNAKVISFDRKKKYLRGIDESENTTSFEYIFDELGFPLEMRKKDSDKSVIIKRRQDPYNPLNIQYAFRKEPTQNGKVGLSISFIHHLQYGTHNYQNTYGGASYTWGTGILRRVSTGNVFGPEKEEPESLINLNIVYGKGKREIISDGINDPTKFFWSCDIGDTTFSLSDQDVRTKMIKSITFPTSYFYGDMVNIAFSNNEYADGRKFWQDLPENIPADIRYWQAHYSLQESRVRGDRLIQEGLATPTIREDKIIGNILIDKNLIFNSNILSDPKSND